MRFTASNAIYLRISPAIANIGEVPGNRRPRTRNITTDAMPRLPNSWHYDTPSHTLEALPLSGVSIGRRLAGGEAAFFVDNNTSQRCPAGLNPATPTCRVPDKMQIRRT